jgi:DNA-directed RNA polymerase
LDKSKQSQAIIPNINHSLDHSHLICLIKASSKDNFQPIISVHDCFGTLPNLMKNLDYRVKKEFVELYSQSEFLNNFHQRFIQSIKDNQFDIIDQDKKSFVVLDKGRNKRLFDIKPKELLEIPILPLPGNLNLNIITKSKSIFGFSVLIYFDTNLLFNIGENLIN